MSQSDYLEYGAGGDDARKSLRAGTGGGGAAVPLLAQPRRVFIKVAFDESSSFGPVVVYETDLVCDVAGRFASLYSHPAGRVRLVPIPVKSARVIESALGDGLMTVENYYINTLKMKALFNMDSMTSRTEPGDTLLALVTPAVAAHSDFAVRMLALIGGQPSGGASIGSGGGAAETPAAAPAPAKAPSPVSRSVFPLPSSPMVKQFSLSKGETADSKGDTADSIRSPLYDDLIDTAGAVLAAAAAAVIPAAAPAPTPAPAAVPASAGEPNEVETQFGLGSKNEVETQESVMAAFFADFVDQNVTLYASKAPLEESRGAEYEPRKSSLDSVLLSKGWVSKPVELSAPLNDDGDGVVDETDNGGKAALKKGRRGRPSLASKKQTEVAEVAEISATAYNVDEEHTIGIDLLKEEAIPSWALPASQGRPYGRGRGSKSLTTTKPSVKTEGVVLSARGRGVRGRGRGGRGRGGRGMEGGAGDALPTPGSVGDDEVVEMDGGEPVRVVLRASPERPPTKETLAKPAKRAKKEENVEVAAEVADDSDTLSASSGLFVVEAIVGHRKATGKARPLTCSCPKPGSVHLQWLVRWEGFSDDFDTWEPPLGLIGISAWDDYNVAQGLTLDAAQQTACEKLAIEQEAQTDEE